MNYRIEPDEPITCAMFTMCHNNATLLVDVGVLGHLASCERCAAKLGHQTTDLELIEIVQ